MKGTQVRSEFNGRLLKGATANCHIAIMKSRRAERKAADDLKADIKRKAAELKTAAELRAADKYTVTAERKAAAVKYRAKARKLAEKYKYEAKRRAMDTRGKVYREARIAAEQKVEELLLEALDKENGEIGYLEMHLRGLQDTLRDRLWDIWV
jgi:hypothetical protein